MTHPYTLRILNSLRAVAELLRDCAQHPKRSPQLVRDFWRWATVDEKLMLSALGALCGALPCFGARLSLRGSVAQAEELHAPYRDLHKPAPVTQRPPQWKRVRLIGKGVATIDYGRYANGRFGPTH